MSTVFKFTIWTAAFAALAVFAPAGPAGAEEPPCYECHDALPEAAVAHDPVDSGDCTACHEDHGDAEELRLVEEGSALCYQCHDEIGAGASIHSPVEDGECTGCHNPHGSANEALLIAADGELCFTCHDEFEASASIHPPVEDGECTACHNPHASANEALLVADPVELCFTCHDEFETSTSMHAPVEDGECTACHNPHASEHGGLLVAAADTLCFTCHEDGMGFKDPVSHAAIEDGCGECHQPHTSPYERLFTANLTLERVEYFEEEQAALCFNCHDGEGLTADKTDDTEFRQGQKNLHALHLTGGAVINKYGILKKKPGQTCVACHLPHTALQQRLIRTEFECRDVFCYTMRFTPNEIGGTCIVGCHKAKTYSRDATEHSSTAKSIRSGYLQSQKID